MKRKAGYMILTATVALCTGASLPFLFGNSVLNPEQQSVKSEVPYCVTSPTVPAKITFAGQEVDLLRYDHRERMDRELMSFTYMHSTTMLTVKRANRYFPIIEPILKANGIPDDFKYLAVIESALNPLAKSPAGAALRSRCLQCRTRTHLRTVTETNGEPGGRPLAGRGNLTLYVPFAGGKGCYQQSATIRLLTET